MPKMSKSDFAPHGEGQKYFVHILRFGVAPRRFLDYDGLMTIYSAAQFETLLDLAADAGTFLALVQIGDITPDAVDVNGDRMEGIDRSEMTNPDDWSQEDIDAWEEMEAELRREDFAVAQWEDRMRDEQDYRDSFWD